MFQINFRMIKNGEEAHAILSKLNGMRTKALALGEREKYISEPGPEEISLFLGFAAFATFLSRAVFYA